MHSLFLSFVISFVRSFILSFVYSVVFTPYMSFTGFAFYIAVRCCFDKHLYLTSCLNARNHNTWIRLPQTGCTARKMAHFIITQDRQTQVVAANSMATTILID